MADPNFILLYVEDPAKSAAFYHSLLGKAPVEASPTFALFALEGGLMLGLWGRKGVQPEADPVGGSELAFAVGGEGEVQALYARWVALSVHILQSPTALDFGFTFCAADPDGHRLRVFAPN